MTELKPCPFCGSKNIAAGASIVFHKQQTASVKRKQSKPGTAVPERLLMKRWISAKKI